MIGLNKRAIDRSVIIIEQIRWIDNSTILAFDLLILHFFFFFFTYDEYLFLKSWILKYFMQIEFYNDPEACNNTLRRQEKITCIRTLLLHFPCQPHLYNVTWLQLIISTLVSTILIKETCYISMHQSLDVMELFWKRKKKQERKKKKRKTTVLHSIQYFAWKFAWTRVIYKWLRDF